MTNSKKNVDKQAILLSELEEIMDENKRLQDKGGLPVELAPLVNILGLKPWQSLLGLSFAVTLVIFFGNFFWLKQMVDWLLWI